MMKLLAVVVVLMVHSNKKLSKSKEPSGAKTEAACFLGMIPWDARYKTHDAELLAWFRLSRFGGPLAGCRQKTDLIILLCSQAPPGLPRAFFARGISESIIFEPRVTEFLLFSLLTIFDLAIVKSSQMQTPCLVGLRERLLGPSVSRLCPHGYKPLTVPSLLQMPCLASLWEKPLCSYVSEPHSPGSTLFKLQVSEPRSYVLEPYVLEPRSHAFEPYFSAPRSHVFEHHAFKPRAFEPVFKSHSFGPHPVSSLHFFDSTRSSFAEHSSCLSHISCEMRFKAI